MRASFMPPAAVATVKRIRPSGSIEGHQWPISRWAESGVVRTTGAPPSAGTLERPASQVREKTMRSSDVQTAPGPLEAGQTTSGSPPLVDTFRIWPSRKNPTQRPSGDTNGHRPPSVPGRARASSASSRRWNSTVSPAMRPSNTTKRPSGGSVTFVIDVTRGGASMTKRTVGPAGARSPPRQPARDQARPIAASATRPTAPPTSHARERGRAAMALGASASRSSSPSTRRASAACCRR